MLRCHWLNRFLSVNDYYDPDDELPLSGKGFQPSQKCSNTAQPLCWNGCVKEQGQMLSNMARTSSFVHDPLVKWTGAARGPDKINRPGDLPSFTCFYNKRVFSWEPAL